MSGWLEYERGSKASKAWMLRRKPPNPDIGSHLPPPSKPKQALPLPLPPANTAPPPPQPLPTSTETVPGGVGVAGAGQIGGSSTPRVAKSMLPDQLQGPVSGLGHSDLPGRSPRGPMEPPPLGAFKAKNTASSSPSMPFPPLPSDFSHPPKVEVPPLGLTTVFSRRGQLGSTAKNADSILVEAILSDHTSSTLPPDPELVRCAEYVSMQPDALDAFLKRYAERGGGHGTSSFATPRTFYAGNQQAFPVAALAPTRPALSIEGPPMVSLQAAAANSSPRLGAPMLEDRVKGGANNLLLGSPQSARAAAPFPADTSSTAKSLADCVDSLNKAFLLMPADSTFVLPKEYATVATSKKGMKPQPPASTTSAASVGGFNSARVHPSTHTSGPTSSTTTTQDYPPQPVHSSTSPSNGTQMQNSSTVRTEGERTNSIVQVHDPKHEV